MAVPVIPIWFHLPALALLLILGRLGEKKLRVMELIFLAVTALFLGLITDVAFVATSETFHISQTVLMNVLVPSVPELAVGLPWIRFRRGYIFKQGRGAAAASMFSSKTAANGPTEASISSPRSSPSIFLSYRRGRTSDVSGRIYDRLVQHFGAESVFKDVDSIPLGVDFRKHLRDSVAQCRVLLAVIGENWVTTDASTGAGLNDPRDFVRIEVESALQRDIPVIPVLVQGASLPKEHELPASMQGFAFYNGSPVRPDPDFHSDMQRLIKGIEHHLATRGPQDGSVGTGAHA